MLDDDTAILAYQVHEDLTVDGEPVSLDASDASVWVRRDGSWVCALHTESLKGDLSGYWSRRLNDEHRLVYTVKDDNVVVIACRYHYDS